MISFEEFKRLAREGNVIPLWEELPVDTETPVSVYRKVRPLSPLSVLLESVEGGEHIARYSFLGFNPFMKFTIEGGNFRVDPLHEDVSVLPGLARQARGPVEALKTIFDHLKTVRLPGLPRFAGGAVGYFGYECARLVERLPEAPPDDLSLPDAVLLFFDVLIVFDNVKHQVVIVSNAYVPDPEVDDRSLRKEYETAAAEISRVKEILRGSDPIPERKKVMIGEKSHLLEKQTFCSMVESAKRFIEAGDVFQVVLSHRVRQIATADPFDVYRNLRRINPSPYMYFLSLGEFSIMGCSPEMLVRIEGDTVHTRPIAGTRRRGTTEAEDAILEKSLLEDPKERAEHLMLVDLGRNDLGRICTYGSVHVTDFMKVEKYSHVMHLVSEIRGRLRPGLSVIEGLFACFPAGTLTGAPKIRAMEIIAETEPVRRGVYGGAIAYLDFSGNLDSCITIRTIVAHGDTLYFQAGAGVVHDSVPGREYEETLEKMHATMKAVEMMKR
ncbi:MAG: anthranilate synthase component I [Bacteroidia bacterium]|nr:MAG: anthranilate synthase component I [Bacteroidia bacterium]